jgi:protein tyrosine phosphatase (PTP) superfamily phosphohydrolase (DUF442 family)/cytochrome c556
VLLCGATFAAAVVVASACSNRPPRPVEVRIAAPDAGAAKATDLPGLHNVVAYCEHAHSGGVPEGEEGLRTLAAMGIKTIISVDGAAPDVATAESLGMRYVHLPIGYDTVKPERQRELAQAIASLPGPVYMHCHHGKHRSAAALASALVLTGELNPQQAQERMAVSGTAKDYLGLWQAVRSAKPLPAGQLEADPASFPSKTTVTGLVATMVAIDDVFDLVKQAQQAGWKAPADHPDLVASKETARLARLFEALPDDAESKVHPDDYQQKLAAAITMAAALDAALQANDGAAADKQLKALTKSCKECHVVYRDK